MIRLRLSLLFCVLLGTTVAFSSQPLCAQSTRQAQFLAVWQPITANQIKGQVALYRNDGLMLDTLMERAIIYRQMNPFLNAVRDEWDKQPDNAILLATYARALATLRSSAFFNGKPLPTSYGKRHNLSVENIGALIERANHLTPTSWLAVVAAEEFVVQGGEGAVDTLRTDQASLARQALALNRNPLTLAVYVDALMGTVWSGQAKSGATNQQAMQILTDLKNRYPWYWRSNLREWQYRAYSPVTADKAKAAKAYNELLATIPPKLLGTVPIQRYLKWQHWDQR